MWLDLVEDGILDTETETVLGKATVQSDDTFTVSFVVNVPPFVRGVENHIRAKDGQTPPNVDEGDGPFFTPATFFVEGLLKLTPKEVAIGDTVVTDQLCGDEINAIFLAHGIGRHNVNMSQACCYPGFCKEAAHK